MNKKLNTLIFLVAATVLNFLLLIILAGLIGLGFALAYRNIEEVNGPLSWLAVLVTMFGAIIGTFFLYSRIVRWATAKWNLENYIEPLFRRGRKR